MRLLFLLIFTVVSVPLAQPDPAILLEQNNEIRATFKKPPQVLDKKLCAAAQDHANFIARYRMTFDGRTYGNPAYSHFTNGGVDARLIRHGFKKKSVRENINMLIPDGRNDVWESWLNSWSHKDTILSNHEKVGFGIATGPDGATYWVAVYANGD